MKKQELTHSEKVLIADKYSLEAFFFSKNENIISQLYKEVFTTPGIYQYFMNILSVEDIKTFRKTIKEVNYEVSTHKIDDVMSDSKILNHNDVYALLCGKTLKMDVLLDDPRKVKVFQDYLVHTIRPTDIVQALCAS